MTTLRDGYVRTEIGVLPDDWNVLSLRELGRFKNGINKESSAFGSGFPFVNLMDVFGRNAVPALEDLGLLQSTSIERTTYSLKQGDVLFVRSSVKPSGVGLTALVEEDLPETVFSGFLLRFRDQGRLDLEFKKHVFYAEAFRQELIGKSSVSANTNINQSALLTIKIPVPPTVTEQKAIAKVLGDLDGLIASLEALIAKKRDIKQGAMQELLSGHRRTTPMKIGDVLRVRHGRSQWEVTSNDGAYPILASGGQIGSATRFLYDKPSVLIGRKGTIDRPQFVDTPFWTIDTLFYTEIFEPNIPKYVFYQFCMVDWRQYNEASGVPSLNAGTIENVEIHLHEPDEQKAIVSVLTDIDAEITALEAKLAKTRDLKQGMMQVLLTGEVRLA